MRRFAQSFISALLGAGFLMQATASPLSSPGDSDLIRERQERILDDQQKRLQELQQLPGVKQPLPPAIPSADESCFVINSIQLKGATCISAVSQHELLNPFEKRCLGSGQLNQLLKAVSRIH